MIESTADKGRLMRLATYLAVAVAILLIVGKTVAWLATDSVALLSSLIDSALDSVASVINLVAVHHALQPADRLHRFGHAKAEPLAGLGQSIFIVGSALYLLTEAVHRLIAPQAVVNVSLGLAVMTASVLLTAGLVVFQRRTVRLTGSIAVGADLLHYIGDLMVNASVIVSLVLSSQFGLTEADPLFAIAIGCFLIMGSGKIAWRSLNLLMDREFPDADRQKIKDICLAHPEVRDIHDLRTRSAGLMSFIQFHLEMDPDITLFQAHTISDQVEFSVRAAFPSADIIIHEDPAGLAENRAVFN